MFDVGFWEICLIGLVSLIVIGPEKLPKVARVAGFWVGKAQNMVASVKMEIKEELQAEDIRQILKEQTELEEAQHLLGQGAAIVDEMASAMNKTTQSIISVTKESPKNDNESK